MDLSQVKLSATEWGNIEIPVSEHEKTILQLISDGYSTPTIRKNRNLSLLSFMKMEYTPEIVLFLYKRYFEKDVLELQAVFPSSVDSEESPKKSKTKTRSASSCQSRGTPSLKKADAIRIENMEANIATSRDQIFEYTLLQFVQAIAKPETKTKGQSKAFYLYTLIQLRKTSITHINPYLLQFIDSVIETLTQSISIAEVFKNAGECIERNPHLLKYEDLTLFSHQRELFQIAKQKPEVPKLVLYIAPTATGKTLSPIGLSAQYRIIFICVARHIGLALAKSAISVGKKIAFAFGCETASDIRLHNSAASVYSIHPRTGGIGRIDNSVGDKVEIMICDVKSYLTAMHYMLAFNAERDIITYWDEPTITMDYEDHPLHAHIHENWSKNMISKVVLSCATLPGEDEIGVSLADFRARHLGAEIHTIRSYDCKKSISILSPTGKKVLPHTLFEGSEELALSVAHCNKNKTLLRYFDLEEVIRYISAVVEQFPDYSPEKYFEGIADITMNRIKTYYLDILNLGPRQPIVEAENGGGLRKLKSESTICDSKGYEGQALHRTTSVSSLTYRKSGTPAASSGDGILLTTKDAHTLTDGPTLFLAKDVEKIGKFYIQQSNIPVKIFQQLREKMTRNSELQQKIDLMEKTKEDKMGSSASTKSKETDKKDAKREVLDPAIRELTEKINACRNEMKLVRLDPQYVPNSVPHQAIWCPGGKIVKNAYAPSIDSQCVQTIMELDVANDLKLLLLLGIGVFMECPNTNYMEIMKRLAYEQKLYLIIASTDYIYGTNYQFCHGFIGKDLDNMTQQKIIQAMGRVGRNNIQQEYTVRFRDETMFRKLFLPAVENREAEIMCRLFSN
jgi:hypothetical protein